MSEFVVSPTCDTPAKTVASRSTAEERQDTHIALCESCQGEGECPIEPKTEADGGPEVIEEASGDIQPEPSEPPTEELPDQPTVDTDPLTWMPSEFTDEIDGTVAINRKGYEVMAHHYGISTRSECVVGPEESGHEYARVKATAETEDGTTYEAHGSASVERGDDSWLLLEMADTRARKRAIAQATGVGMVAVSELQNDL